jgi:hypothetical protein
MHLYVACMYVFMYVIISVFIFTVFVPDACEAT